MRGNFSQSERFVAQFLRNYEILFDERRELTTSGRLWKSISGEKFEISTTKKLLHSQKKDRMLQGVDKSIREVIKVRNRSKSTASMKLNWHVLALRISRAHLKVNLHWYFFKKLAKRIIFVGSNLSWKSWFCIHKFMTLHKMRVPNVF